MAAETPVLERNLRESTNSAPCAVPSRMEFMAEDEHNARIRETYARLINPESKIEDVFSGNRVTPKAETLSERAEAAEARPYFVENARADASIFRADSAVNRRAAEEVAKAPVSEEEDEDLRPTPTTIQYQTINKAKSNVKATSTTGTKHHVFGKREKLFVAVFVAVVVALITLIIVNSTVIANLNADIANVQGKIETVRGAIAGVSSTVEEIISKGINH